jgi:hypothetical protein
MEFLDTIALSLSGPSHDTRVLIPTVSGAPDAARESSCGLVCATK